MNNTVDSREVCAFFVPTHVTELQQHSVQLLAMCYGEDSHLLVSGALRNTNGPEFVVVNEEASGIDAGIENALATLASHLSSARVQILSAQGVDSVDKCILLVVSGLLTWPDTYQRFRLTALLRPNGASSSLAEYYIRNEVWEFDAPHLYAPPPAVPAVPQVAHHTVHHVPEVLPPSPAVSTTESVKSNSTQRKAQRNVSPQRAEIHSTTPATPPEPVPESPVYREESVPRSTPLETEPEIEENLAVDAVQEVSSEPLTANRAPEDVHSPANPPTPQAKSLEASPARSPRASTTETSSANPSTHTPEATPEPAAPPPTVKPSTWAALVKSNASGGVTTISKDEKPVQRVSPKPQPVVVAKEAKSTDRPAPKATPGNHQSAAPNGHGPTATPHHVSEKPAPTYGVVLFVKGLMESDVVRSALPPDAAKSVRDIRNKSAEKGTIFIDFADSKVAEGLITQAYIDIRGQSYKVERQKPK